MSRNDREISNKKQTGIIIIYTCIYMIHSQSMNFNKLFYDNDIFNKVNTVGHTINTKDQGWLPTHELTRN